MCVTPVQLPTGVTVACRKCWQCRANRVNDWVGRCIAESKTSVGSNAITLTYGRDHNGNEDHVRAAVLTYSDVQRYLKRLRKAGYQVRYLVAGEYGSLKGRAHWHGVFFWKNKIPPHEIRRHFAEPFWHHGNSFWDEPSASAVKYCCKYLQKDTEADEAQAHLAMSRKPPLGHDYFIRRAHRYVQQGVSPQDLFYSFPEVRAKDGKPQQFMLQGAMCDQFLSAFIERWKLVHGNDRWPNSELIDKHLDRLAELPVDLRERPMPKHYMKPHFLPEDGAEIKFSEPHNRHYVDCSNGRRLWWSFNQKGELAWQNVIRGEPLGGPKWPEGDPQRNLYRETRGR